MIVIEIAITLVVLISLHELGHVITAKIFGFNIEKIGLTFLPVPHAYVLVSYEEATAISKVLFFLSGTGMTLISFFVMILFGFFGQAFLLYTYAFQFAFETNPFHSDFVFLFSSYGEREKEYLFSPRWYLHFFSWAGICYMLYAFSRTYFL